MDDNIEEKQVLRFQLVIVPVVPLLSFEVHGLSAPGQFPVQKQVSLLRNLQFCVFEQLTADLGQGIASCEGRGTESRGTEYPSKTDNSIDTKPAGSGWWFPCLTHRIHYSNRLQNRTCPFFQREGEVIVPGRALRLRASSGEDISVARIP